MIQLCPTSCKNFNTADCSNTAITAQNKQIRTIALHVIFAKDPYTNNAKTSETYITHNFVDSVRLIHV